MSFDELAAEFKMLVNKANESEHSFMGIVLETTGNESCRIATGGAVKQDLDAKKTSKQVAAYMLMQMADQIDIDIDVEDQA